MHQPPGFKHPSVFRAPRIHRKPLNRDPQARFRPRVDLLEDRAMPALLNPLGFASLGILNPSPSLTHYVIDTGGPNPTLTGPGVNFTGVISGGVAVFDFSSVTINSGVVIEVLGPNPVAILARTTMHIDGTIDSPGVSALDLDVFTPPRADWLAKTDDYLRHGR